LATSQKPSRAPLIAALVGSLVLFSALGALAYIFLAGGETGEIVVRTSPRGASVFVDGERHEEQTPVILKDIPVDQKVTVRVEKEGFQTFTFDATAPAAGGQTKLETDLEASLEDTPDVDEDLDTKKDNGSGSAKIASKHAKQKDATAGKETKKTAASAGATAAGGTKKASKGSSKGSSKKTSKKDKKDAKPGLLKITVKPWAKVYINGEYLDLTPLPAQSLKPGSYKVKLANKDLGKSVTRTVTVKSGKTARINIDWQ